MQPQHKDDPTPTATPEDLRQLMLMLSAVLHNQVKKSAALAVPAYEPVKNRLIAAAVELQDVALQIEVIDATTTADQLLQVH